MNRRKILVAFLMLGITIFGAVYAMNKTPTQIPQSVDTDVTFPLSEQH